MFGTNRIIKFFYYSGCMGWIKKIILAFFVLFVLIVGASDSTVSWIELFLGLLFWVAVYFLWKYLKNKKQLKEAKETASGEFKCKDVLYKGGHILYFGESGGELFVGKDMLTLVGYRNSFEIKMPLNKIDFSQVKHYIGSRGTQQEAMAYAGAHMPLGSIAAMRKDLFVEIPFIDENGKKQNPIFEFTDKKSAEKFQKWLYGKIPTESEKSKKQKEEPIEILKNRYAKGEISKKEYERMKKELSN